MLALAPGQLLRQPEQLLLAALVHATHEPAQACPFCSVNTFQWVEKSL
jgi:hypothetical protein